MSAKERTPVSEEQDSPDLVAQKKAVRRELRAARRARYGGEQGPGLRAEEAQRLVQHAQPLIEQVRALAADRGGSNGVYVTLYAPIPLEADVLPLAQELVTAGASLLMPVFSGADTLEWALWDGRAALETSQGRGFGAEPEGKRLGDDALARADLVFAPALAVDLSGTRIGHGGGYYDRALLHCPATTPVVTIVHPTEVLPAGTLPSGPHDVPVDRVLTANGLQVLHEGEECST